MQLIASINRDGKGKYNVVNCLHACMSYAWESGRIAGMPKFPKKKAYQIVEPVIRWLTSEQQRKVIEAIPLEHQPIFRFLKYHLRRPAEAMALRKEDFDGALFTVDRGFSAKIAIDKTKTGEVHMVPAVSDFERYIEIEREKQRKHNILSPFFFVHPNGDKEGKHYTHTTLNSLWHAACEAVDVDIDLYSGLKHSTASQMINESGYNIHDVQTAGDWARLESVRKYAKTETGSVKQLLERKVLTLVGQKSATGSENESE